MQDLALPPRRGRARSAAPLRRRQRLLPPEKAAEHRGKNAQQRRRPHTRPGPQPGGERAPSFVPAPGKRSRVAFGVMVTPPAGTADGIAVLPGWAGEAGRRKRRTHRYVQQARGTPRGQARDRGTRGKVAAAAKSAPADSPATSGSPGSPVTPSSRAPRPESATSTSAASMPSPRVAASRARAILAPVADSVPGLRRDMETTLGNPLRAPIAGTSRMWNTGD